MRITHTTDHIYIFQPKVKNTTTSSCVDESGFLQFLNHLTKIKHNLMINFVMYITVCRMDIENMENFQAEPSNELVSDAPEVTLIFVLFLGKLKLYCIISSWVYIGYLI